MMSAGTEWVGEQDAEIILDLAWFKEATDDRVKNVSQIATGVAPDGFLLVLGLPLAHLLLLGEIVRFGEK